MRFLCLHGMGTNSKIFEMQTAAIRHGLGEGHSYEYIDGALKTSPAPGLRKVARPSDDYLQYFEPDSSSSFLKALDDLEAFVEQQGPFDGVIGFSAGASLAFALMVRKMLNNPSGERLMPTFRCAIFFSVVTGIGAAVETFYKEIQPSVEGETEIIQVPTAHIWGENDDSYPGSGSWVRPFCRQETSSTLAHPGGHELPGLKDKEATLHAVRAIKRTIVLAIEEQETAQGSAA